MFIQSVLFYLRKQLAHVGVLDAGTYLVLLAETRFLLEAHQLPLCCRPEEPPPSRWKKGLPNASDSF